MSSNPPLTFLRLGPRTWFTRISTEILDTILTPTILCAITFLRLCRLTCRCRDRRVRVAKGFGGSGRLSDEVSHSYNPPSGRIVTANNDPFGYSSARDLSDFQDSFAYSYSSGARAARIEKLLDGNRGSLSVEKIGEIQFDHTDLTALQLISLITASRADLNLSHDTSALVDRLLGWNGKVERNRTEPVQAYAFINEWTREYFEAKLSALPSQTASALLSTATSSLFSKRTLFHGSKRTY